MKPSRPAIQSLSSAILTVLYIAGVAQIIQNGEKIFGQMKNFFGPVAFLLLFVLSAAITGALILGRPVLLYLDGQKSAGVKLFFYTVVWLLAATLIVFAAMILK